MSKEDRKEKKVKYLLRAFCTLEGHVLISHTTYTSTNLAVSTYASFRNYNSLDPDFSFVKIVAPYAQS